MHPPELSIACEQRTPIAHCAGCGLAIPRTRPVVTYERLVGTTTDGVLRGDVHPEVLSYHEHCAQFALQRGQIGLVGLGWEAGRG